MEHWSVDTKRLAQNKEAYAVWRLEQRINFGIGESKLGRQELLDHWERLDLDPAKKKFLALILAA